MEGILWWSDFAEQEAHHEENMTHRLRHEVLQMSQVVYSATLASDALKAAEQPHA